MPWGLVRVDSFSGIVVYVWMNLTFRGFVERCNHPPVRNLITWGSQHNGIGMVFMGVLLMISGFTCLC
jgi:hypothetical protein